MGTWLFLYILIYDIICQTPQQKGRGSKVRSE